MDFQEYFKTMIDVLMKPTNTLKKNKKMELGDGLVHIALAGVVVGVITTIITLGSGIAAIVMAPIGAIIGALIVGTIYYIIAMILGCKKQIGNFVGVYSLVAASLMLVTWIPLVGFIIALYGLYLMYVMLTKAMDMTSGAAIVTILIPILIAIVFAIMLAAFIISMLTAVGLGALGGALSGALSAMAVN